MKNSSVSVDARPYLPREYGNTYLKVDHHPLVGHELKLEILEVFENPDNHALLVKLQNPDGSTQMRRYYQSSLCNNLAIDLPFPTSNDSHSDQLSFEEVA